jgi:hypothetical protein
LLVWQALDRVTSLATRNADRRDPQAPDDPRSAGRWFPYVNRGAYADTNQFGLALKDYQRLHPGRHGLGAFSAGALLSSRPARSRWALRRSREAGYNVYNLPFQRALALAALGRTRRPTASSSRARHEPALAHPRTRVAPLPNRDDARPPADAVRDLKLLASLDPRHEGRQMLDGAHHDRGSAGARDVLDVLVKEEPSARAFARASLTTGSAQGRGERGHRERHPHRG